MAKINYVFEGREDYTICYLFKNKRKAAAKVVELEEDEDFKEMLEDEEAFIKEGVISYKEGFTIILSSDDFQGDVRAMSPDEFHKLKIKEGVKIYYSGPIKDGSEAYLDTSGNDFTGTQPEFEVEYGEYLIGENPNESLKYIPTFESFINNIEE